MNSLIKRRLLVGVDSTAVGSTELKEEGFDRTEAKAVAALDRR